MCKKEKLSDKERNRQYRQKGRAENKLFEKKYGPIPEYLKEMMRNLGSNTSSNNQEPWERAPNHIVKHHKSLSIDEHPASIDANAQNGLSQNASDTRRKNKQEKIADLKRRYPLQWGKRSGAKYIASEETGRGDPITERTVQNYIKRDREKGGTKKNNT